MFLEETRKEEKNMIFFVNCRPSKQDWERKEEEGISLARANATSKREKTHLGRLILIAIKMNFLFVFLLVLPLILFTDQRLLLFVIFIRFAFDSTNFRITQTFTFLLPSFLPNQNFSLWFFSRNKKFSKIRFGIEKKKKKNPSKQKQRKKIEFKQKPLQICSLDLEVVGVFVSNKSNFCLGKREKERKHEKEKKNV